MEFFITNTAKKDLAEWKKSGQKIVINKINKLFNSISQTPFTGIGKPEPLKGNLTGYWSREITKKDRIIYDVENNKITIYSAKGHYFDK